MKIIAGLGNPGAKYQQTRHNAGFVAIDVLAEDCMESFREQFEGMAMKTRIAGEQVLLLKPMTYMNLSGRSIQKAMQFYKVRPQDVIVFVDDINLDLGKIRIRSKGSHGGQNGLRDIIKQIGQDFVRVRLGMGPVPPKWDLASFVLSKMTQADMQEFGNVLDKIPGLTEALLKSGLNEAMNRYNG